MPLSIESRPRHLLPRWRRPRVSSQSGEFTPLHFAPLPPLDTGSFQAALEEFQRENSIESAFDLVGQAVVFGRQEEAFEAAQLLIGCKDVIPEAHGMANRMLVGQGPLHDINTVGREVRAREEIREAKTALRVYPFNAVLWVETSRNYLIVGQNERAKKAMMVALALAPNYRFVLRAATRFFMKDGEPEQAIFYLDRSPSTARDPWLLAARIASAQAANLSQKHIKIANQILESGNLAPQHLSELAGALGTLDIAAGNQRFARRHFNQSLKDPTENAVAQAVYVEGDLRSFKVEQNALHKEDAYEAKARQAYHDGRWKAALNACMDWMEDEPFSANPAILGSFIATEIMEANSIGIDICQESLASNPRHPWVMNNLVVALAMDGRVPEAEAQFNRMPKASVTDPHGIVQRATEGLLAFRNGQLDQGRQAYIEALKVAAADPRHKDLYALGLAHYALEELRVDHQRGIELARQAETLARTSDHPVMKIVAGRLANRAKKATGELSDNSKSIELKRK